VVEELRKQKVKISDEVTMEGLVNQLANLIWKC
jgi:uncharacterized protein YdcH (DUF465 family)